MQYKSSKIKSTLLALIKGILSLFAYILLSFMPLLGISLIPGLKISTPFLILIHGFSSFLSAIFVIYLFRKFVDKKNFLSIGLEPKSRFPDFVWGGLLSSIMVISGTIILLISKSIALEPNVIRPTYIAAFIIMFIVSGIAEEVICRGYILNNLMNVLDKHVALIISALIFSIMHLMNSDYTFLSAFNVFLAGLLLGSSYIYTRNLWFPIGVHILWNIVQGLIGFNVSGEGVSSIFLLSYPKANMMNGGAFGFEGSIISSVIVTIGIVIVFMYYERRRKPESPHLEVTILPESITQ